MKPVSLPRRLWRWTDGVIGLFLLVLAGVLFVAGLPTEPAAGVVITSPTGSQTLPLSADTLLTVEGRGGHRLTVEIKQGQVRVLSADCPDGVCIASGWLDAAGDTTACVPAGISLRVTGSSPVDGIAG